MIITTKNKPRIKRMKRYYCKHCKDEYLFKIQQPISLKQRHESKIPSYWVIECTNCKWKAWSSNIN